MKKGKKTVLRAVLCLLALVVLINAGWLVWRAVRYAPYSRGMEKNEFSTWLVPRYKYSDADRFDYGVKYPEYLSLTGNLSVGMPVTEETVFTDFLIVWPKVFGGCDYGVSINDGGVDYQIYINADGSAADPGDGEIVARHQETVDTLLRKAAEMWD